MNRFGVGISVISNLNGLFYKNTHSANEELYEEIRSDKKFKDRFIPFAVLNPIYAGWKDDLQACVNMGFKGIRLYPAYHDYKITDPACIQLVTMARDYGLPVAFTMRMVDSRQRSWMDISYSETGGKEWNLKNIIPIIKAVPDARYIVLNFANNTELTEDELKTIKNANLIFDTSGRSITDLKEFMDRYGADKFAFGTHSPVLDYLSGQLRIESLSAEEADDLTKDMLRSGNAKKMLGVK